MAAVRSFAGSNSVIEDPPPRDSAPLGIDQQWTARPMAHPEPILRAVIFELNRSHSSEPLHQA